jgi:F0F1-type ATP synthase assembly protein I
MFALIGAILVVVAAIYNAIHHGSWVTFWFLLGLAAFFLHHAYAVALPVRTRSAPPQQ